MKKSINVLVVDDDQMMVKTISDILKLSNYHVVESNNAIDAIKIIDDQHIDCLITDIKMPGMNGVELYKQIKKSVPELPTILMTAYANDDLVAEGKSEGAIAVLNKPINMSLVLNFLSFLRKEVSLVIVDDDPDFGENLKQILENRGYRVKQYIDEKDVLKKEWAEGEVLILDLILKNTDGHKVMKKIREEYSFLPVILITGHKKENQNLIQAAIEDSAFTCLTKPFKTEELVNTINELYRYELKTHLGLKPKKREK